jgi:hypothetical protein
MKGYIKDANGKFHLVDKPDPQVIKYQDSVNEKEKEKVRVSPEAKAWIKEIQECPTKVKLLEDRLRKVEAVLFSSL